jgi:pimeloyl-ACP methyl ester carboxylesterase
VHRDVKPENVLFSAGHAQLADFGVAKAVGDAGLGASLETTTGVAIGSPAYMSPEQVSGDSGVDHRADIYALGILAYEALSGLHPFGAASAREMMTAHLTKTPLPLDRVRPNLPPDLSETIMRCLQKRPADRWQAAGELAHRLDGVLLTVAGPASPGPGHDVTAARFRLTEAVCRKIGRAAFNPRMIGDEMEYLDNGVRSGTLVCFVHGFGLDASDFEPHLRMLPCRGIAPTLYGFEPSRRRRFVLPLDDQFVLLRELLRDVARRTDASTVVLAGFSSGADVVLRLAALPDGSCTPIDGVLALGANLSLDTCFVTRRLARLEPGREAETLRELRFISDSAETLEEWLDVSAYLVRMLRKFQLQIDPLREHGRDLVRPFEDRQADPFVEWYRDARAHGRILRCVFEDTETCGRPLREIQLRHADAGVLGGAYREESLLVEPDTHHFDLMAPDLIARHLRALLDDLGADGRRTTRATRT